MLMTRGRRSSLALRLPALATHRNCSMRAPLRGHSYPHISESAVAEAPIATSLAGQPDGDYPPGSIRDRSRAGVWAGRNYSGQRARYVLRSGWKGEHRPRGRSWRKPAARCAGPIGGLRWAIQPRTQPGVLHSAAFAVLPNIRVGAGKPQDVPSVILT
jgi:hypothetical protein